MTASTAIIDFSRVDLKTRHGVSLGMDEASEKPVSQKVAKLSSSKKAIRARARRNGGPTGPEFDLLYKPIEEWDIEELAKGRPRDKGGGFRGKTPGWINRETHEKIMERFTAMLQSDLRANAANAQGVIAKILLSEEVDDRGKPVVSPSVKLEAAKWLTEHIIGKPTQRIEQDISVKLQAVLAHAIVGGSGYDSTMAGGVVGAEAYSAFATPALGAGSDSVIPASLYEEVDDDGDDD